MRIWRASRSRAFNEATVRSILLWRRDVQLIQEKFHRNVAYSLAEFSLGCLADAYTIRVHEACLPVLNSLAELERSFAALGRGS